MQSELLSELTETVGLEKAVRDIILLPTTAAPYFSKRRTWKILHLVLLFLFVDVQIFQGNCDSKLIGGLLVTIGFALAIELGFLDADGADGGDLLEPYVAGS